MLMSWRVRAVKSVAEATDLTLAPLTVFAGPNSAGKSTVLQSVLMTAQTLRNPVVERPVVLNGPLVELGTYDDVVSALRPAALPDPAFPSGRTSLTPTRDRVDVGFTLRVRAGRAWGAAEDADPEPLDSAEPWREVACDYGLASQAGGVQPRASARDAPAGQRLQPALLAARVRVWDRHEPGAQDPARIGRRADGRPSAEIWAERREPPARAADLSGPSAAAHAREPFAGARTFAVLSLTGRAAAGGDTDRGQIAGVEFSHFLPDALVEEYNAAARAAEQFVLALLHSVTALDVDVAAAPDTPLSPRLRGILVSALERAAHRDADARGAAALLRSLAFSLPQLTQSYRTLPRSVQRKLAQELFRRADELLEAAREGAPSTPEFARVPLPPVLRAATAEVQRFFVNQIRYLGPLREPPRRVYSLAAGTDTRDVGVRGEFTAAVLDTHATTAVRYVPSRVFVSPIDESPDVSATAPRSRAVHTTLTAAVDDWLSYLEVGTRRLRVDEEKLGYAVRAGADGGVEHDVSQFGVGVSQVLPIIVLGLVATPGSTLLIEQPEVHLHPRVQTRLADFFVALTALGTQCLVETHSEHLVNRLRYRASAAPGREVADATAIYFVERDERGSHYREVRINEFGVITNWPTGFFDDAAATSSDILRTGLAKRRRLGVSR